MEGSTAKYQKIIIGVAILLLSMSILIIANQVEKNTEYIAQLTKAVSQIAEAL